MSSYEPFSSLFKIIFHCNMENFVLTLLSNSRNQHCQRNRIFIDLFVWFFLTTRVSRPTYVNLDQLIFKALTPLSATDFYSTNPTF